jgi:hypothetical protein
MDPESRERQRVHSEYYVLYTIKRLKLVFACVRKFERDKPISLVPYPGRDGTVWDHCARE